MVTNTRKLPPELELILFGAFARGCAAAGGCHRELFEARSRDPAATTALIYDDLRPAVRQAVDAVALLIGEKRGTVS